MFHEYSLMHVVFFNTDFYKKISLKNPETLRKCSENRQPKTRELQFLKTQIFTRAF